MRANKYCTLPNAAMIANKFCEFGPGDSVTWPPCMNHPNDPRTPEATDDDATLESIDYAIDWLQMAKIAMINGSTVKAQQLIDDARETLAELAGVE